MLYSKWSLWPPLPSTELEGVKEITQNKRYQETDTITLSSGENEKTGGGVSKKGLKTFEKMFLLCVSSIVFDFFAGKYSYYYTVLGN